jgi:hypothetical protein
MTPLKKDHVACLIFAVPNPILSTLCVIIGTLNGQPGRQAQDGHTRGCHHDKIDGISFLQALYHASALNEFLPKDNHKSHL